MEKTGVSSLHGGWKSVAAQERTKKAPLPSPILVMIARQCVRSIIRYDSTLRGESLRLRTDLMEDSSSLR